MSAKCFRILSIDGGGIRGIIPGQILVNVEELLRQETHNPQARLADHFDLIAGTSTGGILTCAYLMPSADDTSRPRYTAKEAVDLYLEWGDDVFQASVFHRMRTAGGTLDERYPADGLEGVLLRYFGDTRLSKLLRPCLITSYDIFHRRAHFFSQHDAISKGDGWDFLVRDVARATSAAPTFFETARVVSGTQLPYALIDGGVFANNPTMCAFAEAAAAGGKSDPTALAILSLGTGRVNKAYQYSVAKDWGLIGWVGPLIDILMSGVSETVDYQMRKLFDSAGAGNRYMRIDPSLENAKPEMDNVDRENLIALREAGQQAAQHHADALRAFITNYLIAT
ncbi:MAG: patatin-like phospholipase family protein [Phycisphaerales bacterium]|nr:patatin-like phospholipase family protein [Phycisphaerales bacterium]